MSNFRASLRRRCEKIKGWVPKRFFAQKASGNSDNIRFAVDRRVGVLSQLFISDMFFNDDWRRRALLCHIFLINYWRTYK